MCQKQKVAARKKWYSLGQRRCVYCGVQLVWNNTWPSQLPNKATHEHIIPKRDGGKDGFYNSLLCCYLCNQKRGHTPFKEWVKGLPKEEWLLKKYKGAINGAP